MTPHRGSVLGINEDPLIAITRPHFESPPLIEQAITVSFEKSDEFSLGDFGLFWREIQSDLPFSESHPVIDQNLERFENPEIQSPGIRLLESGFLPRCFYKSEDGRELVQVQNDRFTYNWIRVDEDEYPRSEVLVPRFADLFTRFSRFLVEGRCYDPPKIIQCELTNVNIIPVSDFGGTFADAPKAFSLGVLRNLTKSVRIESFSYFNHYLLQRDDGTPFGRLHIQLVPSLAIDDEQPVYKLQLTARGKPDSSDLEGALRFFVMARDAINSAFMASTTKAAQDRWGYQDGLRAPD